MVAVILGAWQCWWLGHWKRAMFVCGNQMILYFPGGRGEGGMFGRPALDYSGVLIFLWFHGNKASVGDWSFVDIFTCLKKESNFFYYSVWQRSCWVGNGSQKDYYCIYIFIYLLYFFQFVVLTPPPQLNFPFLDLVCEMLLSSIAWCVIKVTACFQHNIQ